MNIKGNLKDNKPERRFRQTCRVVGMSRVRPSIEILTAILMAANRRLLFPITVCRALFMD